MSHIIGHKQGSAHVPQAHLFVILVVAVSLVGFMLISDSRWQSHWLSLLCTVAVILGLVVFALNKVNPLAWKQIFQKDDYERYCEGEQQIIASLQQLSDEYTVLCNFTFELLYVQFLILGPQGIYVVGQTTAVETIRSENGELLAGDTSLNKLSGSLWQTSHLIKKVIKKGYDHELLPKPVLVAPHAAGIETTEFDGVAIVRPGSLVDIVGKGSPSVIPLKLLRGFTTYLHQRYFK